MITPILANFGLSYAAVSASQMRYRVLELATHEVRIDWTAAGITAAENGCFDALPDIDESWFPIRVDWKDTATDRGASEIVKLAANGGGGTAVVITPGLTTVEGRGDEQVFGSNRVDRNFNQGESGSFTISCFDANGRPIDLTGHTLKLILHKEGDDTPIVTLSTPAITIGTGDSKHVATIPVGTLTTAKRRCMYVFRSTSLSNTVRMFGYWDVRAAPAGT